MKLNRKQKMAWFSTSALIAVTAFACGDGHNSTQTMPGNVKALISGTINQNLESPAAAGAALNAQITSECETKIKEKSFPVRELKQEELLSIAALPYNAVEVTAKQLETSEKIINGSLSTAHKIQTLFAVDVYDLPAQENVKNEKITLKMTAHKLGGDLIRSELLCSINERICSGELAPEESAIYRHLNPDFFNYGNGVVNPHFASQFQSTKRQTNRVRNLNVFSAELDLDFKELLANSQDVTPLKLLYGAEPSDHPVKTRTLYFVVSDNISVSSDATLVFSYETESSCNARQ